MKNQWTNLCGIFLLHRWENELLWFEPPLQFDQAHTPIRQSDPPTVWRQEGYESGHMCGGRGMSKSERFEVNFTSIYAHKNIYYVHKNIIFNKFRHLRNLGNKVWGILKLKFIIIQRNAFQNYPCINFKKFQTQTVNT